MAKPNERNYQREKLRTAIRKLDDAAYYRGFMDTPANIAAHEKARRHMRIVVAQLFAQKRRRTHGGG